MKSFRVKVRLIIEDYMDMEAADGDDAIIKIQDVLSKTDRRNLMNIFSTDPHYIYYIEELDNVENYKYQGK